MSMKMINDLLLATGETMYMVILGTFFAGLLGLPLGTMLFTSKQIKPNRIVNKILSVFINLSRSIPFIILLVALIPVTRVIVGTSIGTNAAIVPLTLGAVPFFARLVDNIYQSLPHGLIEAGHSMGATAFQMIIHILLPEARPALLNALTVTAITLVNYSAMAGTVGGGGLGDLAIRYGYQRFNIVIMLATVAILIIIVQMLQMLGDTLAKKYTRI
ncbi:MAG: methionine ABC transporter permease [Legionellales bacterium RIFCSPHIGHO2_12_FULL_35_11]|nr:MAG: methionine ABC transporter permease [Legionellales bacterium RIFCSPHIGHO2_12_FULL_35_11]